VDLRRQGPALALEIAGEFEHFHDPVLKQTPGILQRNVGGLEIWD
jgi:hypothetical protein